MLVCSTCAPTVAAASVDAEMRRNLRLVVDMVTYSSSVVPGTPSSSRVRRLRDLLLTTPSAPLRNGIFLLRRSHPSLKTEGNQLASTAAIDFEIACLMES